MPAASGLPNLRPKPLSRGDKVGIVAPASNIKRDTLEAGCDHLRDLGYEPVFSPSILDRDLYFAGDAERRTKELHEMFARGDVKAILCARGGYGANYLLDRLDTSVVAQNPKVFVGYSDITTLLTWFLDHAGLVTFHGPMVAKDFAVPGGIDVASWQNAVTGGSDWVLDHQTGAIPLISGSAEGVLYGGCLSMLAASLGTPYEIRMQDSILFVEDIAAKPFQIDRMLMQLKLAGKLDRVRGIVFGEMLDCVQSSDQDYTLQEVITRIVETLRVPVAFGLRSGHVSRANVTLPLGVRARLEVGNGVQLTILDSATS